jgi:signal transduction histidine kinase
MSILATLGRVQLSTKLTLCLAVTSTLILGAYGLIQLREEERDLRSTAEHDLRLFGAAVGLSVEQSMRRASDADVERTLQELEKRDPAVDVLVFDPAAQLTASSWGAASSRGLVESRVADVVASNEAHLYFTGPNGMSNLVGVFPLRDIAGRSLGAVAVVWPLDELRRDLAATRRTAIQSLASLVASTTAVGWLLALVFVRRPMRRLTEGMKAVEAGNWVTRVSPHGGEEVGAAIAEFNSMVQQLREARLQLIAGSEARERLEAELQRLDKLATLGQLSAGLAHEIGSPLQVLNGRARSIAARTDIPADVARSAGIIDEQSDRIARIVEQLLHLTRRSPAQMRTISLSSTVQAIVDLMETEARRRNVTLRFEHEPDLPPVLADPDQVQQVAMNLITNALRAAPPAGGSVVVQVGRPGRDTAPGVETAVHLTVADNGAGLPPDTARQMFEPFFTTWKERGGTGLGLAIVRSIVTEHGGSIDVASDASGSRISVTFPPVPSSGAAAVAS